MECLGVWFCTMKVLEGRTRLKLVSSFNAAAPTFSVAGTLVVQGLISFRDPQAEPAISLLFSFQ